MPDQVYPEDISEADVEAMHRWCDMLPADTSHREAGIVRQVILDVWPAPPATLADQMRTIADIIGSDFDADAQRLDTLADRVEDVEKGSDEARAELDHTRILFQQASDLAQTNHAHTKEARAEVENIRKGLLYDGGCLPPGMTVAEAVEHLARTFDRLNPDHLAGAERLTRDRTSKESLPVALPDPEDVPKDETWLVEVDGQLTVGARDTGSSEVPWALFVGVWVPDSHITLVSRLVPDVRRVIDTVDELDALPVGSVVLDKNGDAAQRNPRGDWNRNLWDMDAKALLDGYGPVTLVYEPMVDRGERSGSDS